MQTSWIDFMRAAENNVRHNPTYWRGNGIGIASHMPECGVCVAQRNAGATHSCGKRKRQLVLQWLPDSLYTHDVTPQVSLCLLLVSRHLETSQLVPKLLSINVLVDQQEIIPIQF